MEVIHSAVINLNLTNSNDGQGHAGYRTAAVKKAISAELVRKAMHRQPFDFPVRLKITRILGPKQRLFDYDSVLRGSAKQLIDCLTDAGWWHDDGPKFITSVIGDQDATQRKNGPAVLIEVFRDDKCQHTF